MLLAANLPAIASRQCITGQLVPGRAYTQECEDFCLGKCSFYNETLGETGAPSNVTLYRLTPTNVTGISNKDTGNAPGDVSFFLGKKNLTQRCAMDPTGWGCFLDGDNLCKTVALELAAFQSNSQHSSPLRVAPISVHAHCAGRPAHCLASRPLQMAVSSWNLTAGMVHIL